MPLAVAKGDLEQEILAAFNEALQMAKDAGEKDDSANINAQLAANLAAAIHNYVISAKVNITDVKTIVPPGVPVVTAGTAVAQTGATISAGIAQHVGLGTLV